MSVNLTQPQLMLHHMAVEFAEKEIKPFDMAIDKKGDFTEGLFEKLVETGFLGLTLPEEYGGAGFDPISTAQVIYDLATANASVAVTLEGHYKTIDQFVNFGTPALKKNIYLAEANAFLLLE